MRSPARFSKRRVSCRKFPCCPVVVDFFKEVDQQIKTGSHNTVDLKIVLAVGIASITIMEVGANAATPVWVTLAMFGLNHLIAANTPKAWTRMTRPAMRPPQMRRPEILECS